VYIHTHACMYVCTHVHMYVCLRKTELTKHACFDFTEGNLVGGNTTLRSLLCLMIPVGFLDSTPYVWFLYDETIEI
jgi:hypothetical protein